MPQGDSVVHETIDVSGMDSGGVAETILRLAQEHGLQVTSSGPMTYVLTIRKRPQWAFVAGCVSAVTVIGLAFLLVRVTEMGIVTLTSGSQQSVTGARTTVHLSGRLPAGYVSAVRLWLQGRDLPAPRFTAGVAVAPMSPPARPVAAEAPLAPAPEPAAGVRVDATGATQRPDASERARRAQTFATVDNGQPPGLLTGVAPGPAGPLRLSVLAFEDGRRHQVRGLVLIGRDPAPTQGDLNPNLIPVVDPAMSISKTHLAIGLDGAGVWLEDRGSTNGTSIMHQPVDGTLRPNTMCAPHQRYELHAGDVVCFGDRRLQVE